MKRVSLANLGVLLFSLSSSVGAQTPDSGTLLQEFTHDTFFPQPDREEGSKLPSASTALTETTKPSDQKLPVKGFRFSGSVPDSQRVALQKVVEPYVNESLSFAELQTVVQVVSDYLHQEGYALARAYLPPQEIEEGVVEIAIALAQLDENGIQLQVLPGVRISEERLHRTLSQTLKTDKMNHAQLERSLLLLNQLPGIKAVGKMSAGSQPQTFRLSVLVSPKPKYNANMWFDNYGSRYVGSSRVGGGVSLSSPLKWADKLTLQGALSEGLNLAQVDYSLPIGYQGLRLGAFYNALHYELGDAFKALNAKGNALTHHVYVTYPVYLTLNAALTGSLKAEKKHLNDSILHQTTADKRLTLGSLMLEGYWREHWFSKGVWQYDFRWSFGHLDLSHQAINERADANSAKTSGHFQKIAYSLGATQTLKPLWTLSIKAHGQWANKNLDSSEKLSLGGPSGVRAYTLSEGSGNQGIIGHLELNRHFLLPKSNRVHASFFLDAGKIHRYHTTWAGWQGRNADLKNSTTLMGLGFGVSWSHPDWLSVRSSYAHSLSINGSDNSNHGWVQVLKTW